MQGNTQVRFKCGRAGKIAVLLSALASTGGAGHLIGKLNPAAPSAALAEVAGNATSQSSQPPTVAPLSNPAPVDPTAVEPDAPPADTPSAAGIEPIVPPVKRIAPKTPPIAAEPAAKKGAEKAVKKK